MIFVCVYGSLSVSVSVCCLSNLFVAGERNWCYISCTFVGAVLVVVRGGGSWG